MEQPTSRTIVAGGINFVLTPCGTEEETVMVGDQVLGSVTRTRDATNFCWFNHSVHKRLFTSLPTALYDLYLCSEETF